MDFVPLLPPVVRETYWFRLIALRESLALALPRGNKGPANAIKVSLHLDVFPESGVKQKHQIAVFVVLVVIAATAWLWNYLRRPVVADVSGLKDDFVFSVENHQIRLDEIERARKTEYKSSGRNPFSPVQAPAPPVSDAGEKHEIPGPQPPPPPPPLTLPSNVKFYGFGTVPIGTPRLAFFTDGEEIYAVAEGEVLMRRFRILRIGNASVEFEEISSGRTSTAPLDEPAKGSP